MKFLGSSNNKPLKNKLENEFKIRQTILGFLISNVKRKKIFYENKYSFYILIINFLSIKSLLQTIRNKGIIIKYLTFRQIFF